ncbi:MAG: type I-C CRISPR-associated protein Cas8c/Csd1 [Myxococcales bacterium]|nr:type I-C CRISPR-associated protein Cas8c/Csd1 [Myxococcales bacterium]
MILQALYELARRENLMADPDFEPKPVAWLVKVGPGGKFLGITGTHHMPPAEGKKKPKPVPKVLRVPREKQRAMGDRAFFFYDKAEYVFGYDPDGQRPTVQLEKRFGLFRQKVENCAEATNDEGAHAVVAFLESLASGSKVVDLSTECAPRGCTTNDLFAFVFAPDVNTLVTDRPAVVSYWRRLRADGSQESELKSRCLVSGRPCAPTDRFDLVKQVPGGTTSGVAMVSFNSNAFESYGWSRNENAPISREAAEACATALSRLAHLAYPHPARPEETLPRRNLRIAADTIVCYWTAGADDDRGDFAGVFGGLMEARPEEVGELYRSIWRGKAASLDDPRAFYALTLSGAQGRAVVRDWFESTVSAVRRHLARHFADLDLERLTPPPKGKEHPPNFALGLLLEAVADPTTKRGEAVPKPLMRDMVRAILSGLPYPLAALQRAVLRYRAEIGRETSDRDGWSTKNWNDARAALIKAVLNRKKRSDSGHARYEEVGRTMDPTNNSEGYALGRLMAVLERIQQEALGNVNATIVDRYFSGASASPKSVFVRLLKNARHHVRKAADEEGRAGHVGRLDRIVDELVGRFDPKRNGFPAFLDLEQQGLFVLGYHQMRRWLWMNRDERTAWEASHPGAPRPYLWSSSK